MSDFVYIGARPRKAWADFAWASVASSKAKVSKILDDLDGRRRTYLVVSEQAGWAWLLDSLASRRSQRTWRSRILGLADIEHAWALESLLDTRFERCVRRPPVLLPVEALVEVLEQTNRGDFCIGGAIDSDHGMAVLIRGSLDTLSLPLSMFEPSGDGPRPDFDDFEVIDFGQTLRFGTYEASFDAVLYEVDEDYRRRIHKKRRAEDRRFGASLRRLRLQRGLSRDDFPGVSAKSIARIERSEERRPHDKTLQKIAQRLGVTVEEIESY
ncbi:MAG: helix-turn-helix transcriptional regulator [Deltaproteobacteria bacterium]|nr:helix-turn-helix transcriptional regulator [Deltaproteobacteria bacterium]